MWEKWFGQLSSLSGRAVVFQQILCIWKSAVTLVKGVSGCCEHSPCPKAATDKTLLVLFFLSSPDFYFCRLSEICL